MESEGIVERILKNIINLENIKKDYDKVTSAYFDYTKLVGNAQSSIKIVAQDGSPILFEHSPLMKNAIKNNLEKSVKIQFAFHNDSSKNIAIQEFKERNPTLFSYMQNQFFRLYSDLYWIPQPHHIDFTIIDSEFVYYENPHKQDEDNGASIHKNPPFAKELLNIFDKLIKESVLIANSELV